MDATPFKRKVYVKVSLVVVVVVAVVVTRLMVGIGCPFGVNF